MKRALTAIFTRVLFTVVSPCRAEGITPKHSRHFTRYDNCEFIPTAYADGDSFRVSVSGEPFVFRLYYVDAPESDTRFPDRNAEQAQYFGITPEESVAAGKAAAKFVRETLTGKKFTVFTRWASALGSSSLPRHYAVIQVDGNGLADLLVENGLARLHGVSVNHPDGRKAGDYIAALEELERDAKAKKLGAWANSRPELQHPTTLETMEVMEPSRWAERSAFAAGGAAATGSIWLLTALVRRSQQRKKIAQSALP